MRISEKICLQLNRLFPKRDNPGRNSVEEYFEAQQKWGIASINLYPGLDFNNKVVLDAGCGLGGKSLLFSERGAKEVKGIDMDENLIKNGTRILQARNATNVELIQGSIASMPFEDNTFDIILLNDVVEHISRPILKEALKECKRVLKSGGKICLEFPPWQSRDAAHLYDHIYIPWCQVFFSDKTLLNVSEKLSPPERHGKMSVAEHYKDLNRITRKKFHQLVKEIEFTILLDERSMLYWSKLKYVPLINTYLTDRVVMVLSK